MKTLTHSKYPKWTIDQVERKLTQPTSEESSDANSQGTTGTKPNTHEVKTIGHIVIPYTHGLCKSIKKICSKCGIQTHFKGNSTIKNLLVFPKDKDPMQKKVGPPTGSNAGTLHVMNTQGRPLGPLEKVQRTPKGNPPLYITIVTTQTTLPNRITSK